MNGTTKKLTNSALMIALAQVLSLFAVFNGINGGDVTIGGAVPIIIVSFMYSTRWGVFTALVSTLVNMLLKGVITTLPADFGTYALMLILDYVLAFGVIGLAGFFERKLGNTKASMVASAVIVNVLRFVCHFISGIVLWGSFAPDGQPVWLYSLLYNGGYMLPETVITAVLIALLPQRLPDKIK